MIKSGSYPYPNQLLLLCELSYLPFINNEVSLSFCGKVVNDLTVMVSNTAYITYLFLHAASSFRQFNPTDIAPTLETSCLFCFLSADVYIPIKISSILNSLSSVTFRSEPFVQFGFINFKDFRWQENQTLKEVNKEDLNSNDFVLFPRTIVDRTCLLPAKTPPPKAYKYKGALSESLIVDFVNNYCNTYRTVKGGLTIEGLHRQEIHQNLFSVSSVSSVTASSVFKSKKEDNSCLNRDKNGSCNDRSTKSVFQNDPMPSIPKCGQIEVPTQEEFFHNFLKLSKPVIIKNAINDWPALWKWSNDYLKNEYGDKDVHIKLTSGGDFEGVEPAELWENYKTFKIPDAVKKKLEFSDLVVVRPASLNMNFSDFVDLVESVSDGTVGNVSAYLEYSSIPEHLPELESDIMELTFISKFLQRKHLNIWFSDGNTLGKLHFDPFDNLLCQVMLLSVMRLLFVSSIKILPLMIS